ncbi:MAG TPA: hypothetical protein VKW70_10670 [Terriglobia bacterium]|nr:hypothetical protein [Terriglobia bacterium]
MKRQKGKTQRRGERALAFLLLCFMVPAVSWPQSSSQGGPSGADQILTSIYDSKTNSIRVSGSNNGGTVSSVGLSMPSEFGVTGSPVTSTGTLTVNWAQPLSIAHGGTGQSSPSAAFNALAPPTSAGGLIYGTGANVYGNLSLGASGQCLQSNGTTLVWGACSSGSGFTAGGDLSGTAANQTVTGLQGRPVSALAPASGQFLEWSGAAWTPTTLSGIGTVTSVGLSLPSIFSVTGSPVTSSGVLSATLSSQNANYVFAGPGSGSAGAPAFRPLVGADVPPVNLSANSNGGVSGILSIANGGTGQSTAAAAFNALAPSTATGGLIYGTGANTYGNLALGASGQCLQSNGTTLVWGACASGSGFTASGDLSGSATTQTVVGLQGHPVTSANPATGQILQWNGSVWAPTSLSASGTVTSVGLSLPSIFNVTGTPVTTSGTLSATLINQNANTFLSGPTTGVSAAPTFRALVSADVPAINLGTGGNGGVAGTLGIANGGTGLTSVGTSGQCLTSNGTAMVWGSCGSGGGSGFTAGGDLSGTSTSQTVIGLQGRIVSAAAPASGQVLAWSGAAWAPTTISGGSLPSSWTVNGTTNAVTAQTASGQDATPLTVLPSITNPTADIFDVCSSAGCTSGTKYFSVGPNGNVSFNANSLALGAINQSTASNMQLYGGTGAGAYLELFSPTLSPPAFGNANLSSSTSAGSVPAGTYTFWVTYLAGPAQQYETTPSTSGAISTSATGQLILTLPSVIAGVSGINLYGKQQSNGSLVKCGSWNLSTWTNGSCTATISGNTVTITGWANSPSTSLPTANNTGGLYQAFLGTATGMSGALCESAAVPGQDCAAGNWLMTNPMTTAGDLIYGGTPNAEGFAPPQRLAIGSVGQCLTVVAGPALGWGACGSGGGSGSVTSVGLSMPSIFTVSGSPVTTSGTISVAYATQNANTVLAGPASGAAAAPTFRGIVASDLAPTPITNDCLGYNGTSLAWVGCGGGSGSSAWSALTAPAGNAALNMAGYSTTFNWTDANGGEWLWDTNGNAQSLSTTASTSTSSQSSPTFTLGGTYWNGTASANDTWTMQNLIPAGSNPAATLWFNHAGSSGAPIIKFDNNGSSAGEVGFQLCGTNACNSIYEKDNGGTIRFSVSGSGSLTAYSMTSNNSVTASSNYYAGAVASHFNTTGTTTGCASGFKCSDIAGVIALSSATSASYTFSTAYASAPVCVVSPTSNPGTATWWVTTTTTAVTVNASAASTLNFNYHCVGDPN